jgi:hypothetical protein
VLKCAESGTGSWASVEEGDAEIFLSVEGGESWSCGSCVSIIVPKFWRSELGSIVETAHMEY